MSLQKVLPFLPKLNADELAELQGRISYLSQNAPASSSKAQQPVDADTDMILETLVRALSSMGVEFSSVAMLRSAQQYAAFKQKAPHVLAFLRHACPNNRVQQIAVLTIGIKLLYANLERMGLQASSRYVMAHIHRVPSILNEAFPGYARAGVLGWIARGRKSK
jgi:hypothetical protein